MRPLLLPDPEDDWMEWSCRDGQLELHDRVTSHWWRYHHPLNQYMRDRYPETPERVAIWVAVTLNPYEDAAQSPSCP